ncbi:MAG: hypothetical protein WDN69_23705 [Aliidongia sp.]
MSDAHRRFYRELRVGHFEGDFLMVHAGLRPNVPLESQIESDLLWIRDPFLTSDAISPDRGAWPYHRPPAGDPPNRIGIDTGAFHTGRLTCLVLQGTELGFLQT